MKKIWYYTVLSIIGALSLAGIKISSAIATPTQAQSIEKINQTTPLYLHLGGNGHSSQGTKIADHESHYSHSSHESHYSHYSSRY